MDTNSILILIGFVVIVLVVWLIVLMAWTRKDRNEKRLRGNERLSPESAEQLQEPVQSIEPASTSSFETVQKFIERLKQDKHVLGWVVFADGRMIQANRAYDQAFQDAITGYVHSVLLLGKELHLKRLELAQIRSEEGLISLRQVSGYTIIVITDGDFD